MNWSYILLSYSSLLALGFTDNVRGPVFAEILQDFHLSNTLGAWVFASSSLAALGGSFVAPLMLRRLKRVGTLQVSLLLMALGMLGCSLTHDFFWFVICAIFLGFSFGSLGVVQNLLAAASSEPLHRERILNGLHAMYGLASVMAPLGVAALASFGWGWRNSYQIAALLTFLVLGLATMIQRGEWLDLARISALEDKKLRAGRLNAKDLGGRRSLRASVSEHAGMAYLSMVMAFYVIAEIMVSSRLALYVKLTQGLNIQAASFYVMGFFLAMLAGRLLFTLKKFNLTVRFQMLGSLFTSISCLLLGLYYGPWGFIFSGLAMAPFYPLAISYMSEHYHEKMDLALSWALGFAAVFIVLMHLTVGYLTDRYSVKDALLVGPIFLFISGILFVLFEVFHKPKPLVTSEVRRE